VSGIGRGGTGILKVDGKEVVREEETRLVVSLRLDVRLADGAAVFVVFPAKITTEVRGTYPYRKEPLGDKLLLDFERLQRRRELSGELRDSSLRCLRRSPQAEPCVDLVIRVT
jgi:hypothetical protein